ncbi:MAG TPA: OmpH family outer membrane protein, partial [Longimicrobiales bacterium]|nr:OmpH family outer membrane protein [Longimicrobiales bacterium]
RLFQEAPGATEARTTFQREMDKYRAELALLEDSIKNMVTEYQQKQVMLSPDAKKKQEDAINAKQRVYDQRSQQIEQLASKRQQELVGPIMTRINSILETIRKEEGYVIILDASQAGVIVSADTTLDLTAKVLAKLKTAAPASGVPKAPGK